MQECTSSIEHFQIDQTTVMNLVVLKINSLKHRRTPINYRKPERSFLGEKLATTIRTAWVRQNKTEGTKQGKRQ